MRRIMFLTLVLASAALVVPHGALATGETSRSLVYLPVVIMPWTPVGSFSCGYPAPQFATRFLA